MTDCIGHHLVLTASDQDARRRARPAPLFTNLNVCAGADPFLTRSMCEERIRGDFSHDIRPAPRWRTAAPARRALAHGRCSCWIGGRGRRHAAARLARRAAAQYQTETVEKGTLTVTVTATGELKSLTQVNIGTEISGIVESVNVDFNSPVRVGQVLARGEHREDSRRRPRRRVPGFCRLRPNACRRRRR